MNNLFAHYRKFLTISNFLTIIRIILSPIIVLGVFYQQWIFVFILFLFVGFTDLLDGYLARLLNQETELGKLLDPIADKILLISSFSALAFLQSPSFFIPSWFVLLIVLREIIILFGSFFLMIKRKIIFKISPTIWGKLTTLFQLLFILWLFICYFFGWVPAKTYYILLSLLALFSILSLFSYVTVGVRYLQKKSEL